MEKVHMFAVDKAMRNEVKDYIIEYLKKEIISKAFQNQPVVGFAEAKTIIEQCFANMDKEFGTEIVAPYVNENE